MKAKDKIKILEWCGWKSAMDLYSFVKEAKDFDVEFWYSLDEPNEPQPSPDLDMNFYFKYVVPKLSSADMCFANGARFLWILEYGDRAEAFSLDPAEAFGEALLKLIGEDK